MSSDEDEYGISSEATPIKATLLDLQKPKSQAARKKPAGLGAGGKTVEEIYQKKTQLEHILLRPDSYIGSIEPTTQHMWVWDKSENRMVSRTITFVPGLFKIFDEILVNAADNKIRDPGMDTVKVSIDRVNNVISVFNNGRGIPIEMHSKEKVYVPELIFGHLLTSSNYNDDEKKVTGGRNGYGAKLTNIFSVEFTVETATGGQKFKQVYTKNMSEKTKPSITAYSREDFTRVVFKPDLARFKMADGIDDDLEALLLKRVYDLAGSVRDVKVFLNDERIKIRGFKQYIELYLPKEGGMSVVHESVSDRWEVCVGVSDGQFQQVSFVNSICTYKGGTHVNYVADQIVQHLLESINKKNKGVTVKPFQVKSHLWIFVNCLVENPTFDSQTKENMTLKASSFGSTCALSEEFYKKVAKCGIVEQVLNWARSKQDQQLKKTDGHKKSRLAGISKLDDANNAGTRNAHKCTLILTEGDSAKSLVVGGLSVVGRENYGVFPLRGKLLNVREASHKQIMENQEINFVKQILGLQHGKQYTSTESLRYGRLMIMTDQDHDGSHIKGLVINFLDHFWPSLLRIPGFLLEFITPIVKVTRNKTEKAFFTIPEYEEWKRENNDGKGWNIKYYKGLGTSTTQDAVKYFSNLDLHMKQFSVASDGDRDLIDMAFSKKKADARKEWLRTFVPGTFIDHRKSQISIEEFVNKELVLFSVADNTRSIPCIVDGLKPGHRKVIFSCFKRRLKGEIKVAQLAGYVSEHSAYHHGEQSLCSTIVGLAQDYVGSNNVNLLLPIGQFGTRLQGGKDAASPRYIFTSLSRFARLIFREEDDNILNYLHDDGQSIEPDWYIPVIPMVLVNGTEGIGTGWSTSIPNFNPRDIVANIKRIMRDEPQQKLVPWYRGFHGAIEEIGANKYRVSGTLHQLDDTTIEVSELPIGNWTQNYKEFLEGMMGADDKENSPFLKDFKEYHTDTSVRFVINLSSAAKMQEALAEGLEKKFKVVSSLSTSNLVCFDRLGKLKKYESPEQILSEFFEVRLELYHKRKAYLADKLLSEWNKLDNKARFIQAIVDKELVIGGKPRAALMAELKDRGFMAFNNPVSADEEHPDEREDSEDVKGYNYLLSMPIWSLTLEKVQQLLKEKDAKEQELKELLSKTPVDLWNSDLDAFLEEWERIEEGIEDAYDPLAENDKDRPRKKATKKKIATAKAVAKSAPKSSDSVLTSVFQPKMKESKSDESISSKPWAKFLRDDKADFEDDLLPVNPKRLKADTPSPPPVDLGVKGKKAAPKKTAVAPKKAAATSKKPAAAAKKAVSSSAGSVPEPSSSLLNWIGSKKEEEEPKKQPRRTVRKAIVVSSEDEAEGSDSHASSFSLQSDDDEDGDYGSDEE